MSDINKEKRNISGIYFRAKKDNKWQPVCFEDLELSQQRDILTTKNREFVDNLVIKLADTINEISNQFNLQI